MITKDSFDQLVTALSISPLSIDTLDQIILYLEQQTDELLPSFISQSFQSLFTLEHWTWKLFSQDSQPWIHHVELFHKFASFNRMLIFNSNHIEADKKSSLLIPEDIQCINQIFEQIQKIQDDNDPFFIIISRWFDNLSYLIHEYSLLESSPIIIHICQHIGNNYLLTDQFKFYLTQLGRSQISQSVFTAKQQFYIKTCSFLFRMYACSKIDKLPFTGDGLLDCYGDEYLQLIHVHSHTVNSWDKELLTCVAHLTDLICACCWWGNDRAIHIKTFFSSEQIFYDFIQGLIRIVDYKPFYECILPQWYNDETILIDSIFIFLMGALTEIQNLSCFIRSETILSNIILEIAQKSSYDRVSVCAYGILAEILSDEQLRQVKITDKIFKFFFDILELAWNHPTQCYKRIPTSQLLTGFLTLSKNDAIQQKTADSNKISLLIEMSDQYPITLNILWSLSFNENIQDQLRSNTSFMSKLNHLKEECTNEKQRKVIFGILWNLESNRQDRSLSELGEEKTFDIMISYSHKDELLSKKIYEELIKSGYHVWIDFDQMHGNIMDSMAQAIERSHTIIICMSEQYRRSNYCRAEAHYAFQRELKIVPILLQEHYQPDGWLLFLIGQLLYVDFIKYEFPRAMELLVKELKAPRVVLDSSNPPTNVIVSPTPPPSLRLPENIIDWTEMHVQSWLIEHNLRQMARLLADFDGPSLLSLSEILLKTEPHQILTLFQEDSLRRINERISLLELARFRVLLNDKQRSSEVEKLRRNSSIKQYCLTYCHLM